jgi:hypothetical protein
MIPFVLKLSLGLQATIAFEVVPFGEYVPFPALLPLIKCGLEVVL